MPLIVEVLDTLAAWDALQPAWDLLFAHSPVAVPPLSWTWGRTWWRCYNEGSTDAQPRIVTFRRGSRLVGLLPLYARAPVDGVPQELCFLSTGEEEREETCPQHLDILHAPGAESACRDAFARLIGGGQAEAWDRLRLNGVAAASALLRLPEVAGWHTTRVEREDCFVADLAGGFDAYLARLHPGTRQEARRLLRRARQVGATLDVAEDPPTIEAYFAEMVALHQRRWLADGRPGCFASPRFSTFHRELARELAPRGEACLARLRVGRDTLAVMLGYGSGTRFQSYVGGVRTGRDLPLRSPGIATHLLLMQHLCRQGFASYDLLHGKAPYKLQHTTVRDPTARARIERTLPARLLRLARRVLGGRRAAAGVA